MLPAPSSFCVPYTSTARLAWFNVGTPEPTGHPRLSWLVRDTVAIARAGGRVLQRNLKPPAFRALSSQQAVFSRVVASRGLSPLL